jgi:hypothetical protein
MKSRRNRKAAMAKAGVALAATALIPDTADAQRLVTMPALSIARFQTAQIHLGSDRGAVRLRLQPGETLVMYGTVVPHCVTPVGPGRTRITAPACYRSL